MLIGALLNGPFVFANGRTEQLENLEKQRAKRPTPTNQIGFGSSFSTSLYKEGDTFDIPVVPSINYNYKRFSFRGVAASFRLLPLTRLTLKPDFNSVDPDDGEYNQGLTRRKRSLDLGLTLMIPGKYFISNLSVERDISGHSEGIKYSFGVSKAFQFNIWKNKKLSIVPGLFYAQHTKNWSRYYFGVSPEEARADRPEFTPNATHQYGGRLIFNYPVADKYALNAFYSYTKYSSAVEDSPLTKRGYRSSLFLGLNYILGPSTMK